MSSLSFLLHQLVLELDPHSIFFFNWILATQQWTQKPQHLQLVEAFVEELWKGFLEMQQSLTQITDFITQVNIQPIGENPQRNWALRNPPSRHPPTRNQEQQTLQVLPPINQAKYTTINVLKTIFLVLWWMTQDLQRRIMYSMLWIDIEFQEDEILGHMTKKS